MNSKKHGFTLIELLVVITILSILSGIVVPIISGVSDWAIKASVQSDFKNIKTGLEIYYFYNEKSPTSLIDIEEYLTLSTLSIYLDVDKSDDSNNYNVTTANFTETSYKIIVEF